MPHSCMMHLFSSKGLWPLHRYSLRKLKGDWTHVACCMVQCCTQIACMHQEKDMYYFMHVSEKEGACIKNLPVHSWLQTCQNHSLPWHLQLQFVLLLG